MSRTVKEMDVAEAPKQKRVRRKVGDILRIDLGSGRHAYAQVGNKPLVVFFEGDFDQNLSIEQIVKLPVIFKLWVFNHAITRGAWPVISSQPLTPESNQEPFFYRQDILSGRLFLYHSTFAATNYERPASFAECEGLECAAVWEPEHVVERIRDHLSRRLNRWVESMKIKVSAIPD